MGCITSRLKDREVELRKMGYQYIGGEILRCFFCKKANARQIAVTITGAKIPCCYGCTPFHSTSSVRSRTFEIVEEIGPLTIFNGRPLRPIIVSDANLKVLEARVIGEEIKIAEKIEAAKPIIPKKGIKVAYCSLCRAEAQWIIRAKKGSRFYRCQEHVKQLLRDRPPWLKSIERIYM
ncbi:MAG: hypothetical protein AAB352_01160 [Patescibacteria group bacterium]